MSRALAALPNLRSLDLPDAPETLILPANVLSSLQALTIPGFMLPLGTDTAELEVRAGPFISLLNRSCSCQTVHVPA